MSDAAPPKIDREKTCPFLIRTFVKPRAHHDDADFEADRLPVASEFEIFTWRDGTLREVLLLLRDAAPHLRSQPQAIYSVKVVYFDTARDRFVSRELARISASELITNGDSERNRAIGRTFDEMRFTIGNYLDVAIIDPTTERERGLERVPRPLGRPGFGPPPPMNRGGPRRGPPLRDEPLPPPRSHDAFDGGRSTAASLGRWSDKPPSRRSPPPPGRPPPMRRPSPPGRRSRSPARRPSPPTRRSASPERMDDGEW